MYNISQKPLFPFNFRTENIKDLELNGVMKKIYLLLDELVSKFNNNAKDLENKLARFGPTQVLSAGDLVEHIADTYEIIGNGTGAVVLTSVPTISAGYPGARILLIGTDDTRTVTLQDETQLTGSNLMLGGSNVTLAKGQTLYLVYSGSVERWIII